MRTAVRSVVLAAAVFIAGPPLPAAQPQEAFEVASVRPAENVPGEVLARFGAGCDGSFPRVANNRFEVTTTVYALMTWAYGYNDRGGCGFVTNGNLISAPAPSLATAFQEQLGLRIEDSRGPVDALVIEGAEGPTAN